MKILIITGASRGIGRATCERFQQDQWQIYNLSRTPSSMAGVHNLAVDLEQIETLATACAPHLSTWKRASRLCIIHNAAGFQADTVETMAQAIMHTLFQINICAAVALNQLVLPFAPRGSSILYVGSTLSEQGSSGAATYITLKHAVVGLMRATCQDLAGRGVHTACICPGFTDTEMLQSRLGPDPSVRANIGARMSGGRLIAPAEIAEFFFFAACNPAIDGAVVHANLGQIQK